MPVVKNQGIPAYDPRAVKGIGVTYAMSTMGADHTSGYAEVMGVTGVEKAVAEMEKERKGHGR